MRAQRAATLPRRRRSCSARASATSPTRWHDAVPLPYDDIAALAGVERRRARRPAGRRARVAGRRVAGAVGPRALLRGPRSGDRRRSRRACMGRLGVQARSILTNAAGGINTGFAQGALMVIDDHINLLGQQSARRAERRPLRPALSGHDRGLLAAAARASPTRRRARAGVPLQHGVYVAVHGPSYETPAEIRAFRTHRRRRRRHVHGARGDRRAAHGHGGAGHLVHHQHGGRRAAAAARPRRGDGDGAAACAAQFIALLEGIIEPTLIALGRARRAHARARARAHARAVLALQGRRRARDRRRRRSSPAATSRTRPTA